MRETLEQLSRNTPIAFYDIATACAGIANDEPTDALAAFDEHVHAYITRGHQLQGHLTADEVTEVLDRTRTLAVYAIYRYTKLMGTLAHQYGTPTVDLIRKSAESVILGILFTDSDGEFAEEGSAARLCRVRRPILATRTRPPNLRRHLRSDIVAPGGDDVFARRDMLSSGVRGLGVVLLTAALCGGIAAPAVAAPLAPVAPTGDVLRGCTEPWSLGGTCSDVDDDTVWGSAATQADPAKGIVGSSYIAVRWTVPNEHPDDAVELSNASYTGADFLAGKADGNCTIHSGDGTAVTTLVLAPGATGYVYCHVGAFVGFMADAWALHLGPHPVDITVDAEDLADGETDTWTTRAWLDWDYMFDVVPSEATLTLAQGATCTPGSLAEATLAFTLDLTPSAAAVLLEPAQSAGLTLWIADPGGIALELVDAWSPPYEYVSYAAGSAAVPSFDPDDGNYIFNDLEPRLLVDTVTADTDISPAATSVIWRRISNVTDYHDVLSYSIPVQVDPQQLTGSIRLRMGADISGYGEFGIQPIPVNDPCAPTPGPDDDEPTTPAAHPPTGAGDVVPALVAATLLAFAGAGARMLGRRRATRI